MLDIYLSKEALISKKEQIKDCLSIYYKVGTR